jgi:hypothetical protein
MSQIAGPGPARIAWGYRTAAELGAWKITISREDGVFRRTLAAELRGDRIDLHALRQPGLMFVVLREGRPPLSWPVTTIHIGLAAVTGELGAKEDGAHVVAIRTA